MARSLSAGSSQYITIPSAASINLGSSDFTVATWVRFPVAPANSSMIIGKRDNGFDNGVGWELKFNDGAKGEIRWDLQTDITGRERSEAEITSLVDGDWHLLAADRTNVVPEHLRIWFDGSIQDTELKDTAGSVNGTTPLVIGAAYDTPYTNFLTGNVAEVVIFGRLLTAAEHQALAAGFSPLLLRPLPAFYMPLIGRASPEIDRTGGLLGTLAGSPGTIEHPRIVPPQPGLIGQDLWYELLAVEIDGQSTVVAVPVRARNGAAIIDGVSVVTPTTIRARNTAAQIDGQSTVAGNADLCISLGGTISGQSTVTADIEADAAAAAQIDAQSTVDANVAITANIGVVGIDGQSNVIASAEVLKPLAVDIDGQSTVTANIEPVATVSVTIAAQSTVTADGDKIRTMAVDIDGQSTVAADTAIDANAAAEIDAQADLTGTLAGLAPVAVQIDAQGNLTADASAARDIAATVPGSSTLVADFVRARDAAVDIDAQSTVTATGFIDVPISAAINAQSTVTANLAADVPLAVAIDGQSELTAKPDYPGRPITTAVGGFVRWLFTAGGRISRDV